MNSVNGGILVKRSRTVELNFPSAVQAGSIFNFKDEQQLRDVTVYGIETFSQDQLTKAKSGALIPTLAMMATLQFTFVEGTTEKIYRQPATSFISSVNGGMFRLYDGLKLNLVKSQCIGVDTGVPAGYSVVVAFYYWDNKLDFTKRNVKRR